MNPRVDSDHLNIYSSFVVLRISLPPVFFVNTPGRTAQYLIVQSSVRYSATIGPAMTLATLIVTALATAALAFVGITQIVLHIKRTSAMPGDWMPLPSTTPCWSGGPSSRLFAR